MIWLKQSTAADVLLGPFVDDTDFKTAETALTISQADIRLSKNGGAYAQTNNATGATHRENGHYIIPLDATDTNTLGRLRVAVLETGALQVWADFMVVPANVWDSFFGADLLQVDTREVGGTTQTAGDIIGDTNDIQTRLPAVLVSGRMDSSVGAMGANVLTASALATDARDEIVDQVWDEARSGHIAAGSFGEGVASVQGNVTGSVASVTGAVGSVTAAVTVGTNNDKTGYSLSAAAIQAIWDALTSALTTVGSIGKLLVDNINAAISSRASQTSVDAVDDFVDTEVAAIKAKTDQLTFTVANQLDANVLSVAGTAQTARDLGVQLDAAVSTRATPAQVNAEVVDALNVDTYAEPGQEAPPATTTLVKKIGYLYKLLRNRITQTSTTLSIYADDATTVDQKATVSDNGTTFDRGEIGTGP